MIPPNPKGNEIWSHSGFQVRVAPDDRHALRFLWWEDSDLSKNPVDHQMLVHLFGTSSSPCCASLALKKTAKDFGSNFDAQTVDTVNRNFYVDDCLKSVATVPEASRLANQPVQLLAKGGFHLTNGSATAVRSWKKFLPVKEHLPSLTWIYKTCLLTALWAPSGTWRRTH